MSFQLRGRAVVGMDLFRIGANAADGSYYFWLNAGDDRAARMLAAIHDAATGHRLAAERALLAGLDGSCETPIGGLAELDGDTLHLRGEIRRHDGSRVLTEDATGRVAQGPDMGRDMAAKLLAQAGAGFFD